MGLAGRSLKRKIPLVSRIHSLTYNAAEEVHTIDAEESTLHDSEPPDGEGHIELLNDGKYLSYPTIENDQPFEGSTPSKVSKAAHAAAVKGLNLSVALDQGDRRSRIMAPMGLPTSPRPPPSPRPVEAAPGP